MTRPAPETAPGADDPQGSGPRVRRVTTGELRPDEVHAIRAILDAAFGDDQDERFTDEDWEHALGGLHVIIEIDGQIVSHAAVVTRDLAIAGRHLQTGYVEAVATAPTFEGRGHGTTVMRAIGAAIADRYELGALGTGRHAFYERLGWQTWRGPSSVRTVEGERATPDDDGFILVLATPRTPPLDLTAPISCEWRPGDVW